MLLNWRCLLIYCYDAETVVSKSCVSTDIKSCGGCCETEGGDNTMYGGAKTGEMRE